MSDRRDRFAEIEQAWVDARDHYEDDRKRASGKIEKAAVDANHNAVFEAYSAALDSALSRNSPEVETVCQALGRANKDVIKARDDLVAFAALLGKLRTATALALDLVSKAT